MVKCSNCGREYVQEFTRENHEKICKEKSIAIKKHPERYKGVKLR